MCVEGDGRLGLVEFGPYNAIHVGAAASLLPQEVNSTTSIIFNMEKIIHHQIFN